MSESDIAAGADAPGVRSVAASKVSAVDLVTAEVRRSILTGALAPGQSFAVNDLARQLGVSHIPVREALRRLEVQGLVVLSPTRSPSVAPLDVADIEAIYALRLRLEPPLAARATAIRSNDWIRQLERLLHDSFDPHAHSDKQWDNHHRFHRELVRPAASAWELRFLHQLWDAADRYTRLVFDPQDISGPAERAHRAHAHRDLLEPVAAGDADAAEAALHDHLLNNISVIRQLVERALQPTPR